MNRLYTETEVVGLRYSLISMNNTFNIATIVQATHLIDISVAAPWSVLFISRNASTQRYVTSYHLSVHLTSNPLSTALFYIFLYFNHHIHLLLDILLQPPQSLLGLLQNIIILTHSKPDIILRQVCITRSIKLCWWNSGNTNLLD